MDVTPVTTQHPGRKPTATYLAALSIKRAIASALDEATAEALTRASGRPIGAKKATKVREQVAKRLAKTLARCDREIAAFESPRERKLSRKQVEALRKHHKKVDKEVGDAPQ